ncbi:hypothetical protein [Enterobacter cancerogenus]|uniref:Uncharacterized protein n=1 Tax=Enterobacter cancerogenus TaxID=69218 RepID=A0A484XLL7_9ENTR|nr:Uncharacterised protein [Enterobacter cancerogenus]HBI6866567.1 hypothetical protein [Enterobacter cancerogenus]
MHSSLEKLKDALDNLSDAVNEAIPEGENTLLLDKNGISYPALYPGDLVDLVNYLTDRLDGVNLDSLEDDEIKEINFIINKIKKIKESLVPHLFNGNGITAIPSFINSLNYISFFFSKLFDFNRLQDTNLLPQKLSRRIKVMDARVKQISPDIEGLEQKVKTILDAHATADNLPLLLDELQKYRNDLTEAKDDVQKSKENSDHAMALMNITLDESEKVVDELKNHSLKAQKYLAMCEQAIRASTSKGLAGAFEIKAEKLNWSIRFWVVGLALALSVGGFVGYERLKALSVVLSLPEPSVIVIITQLLLSVLSIGAPLWFAWLSTKQINQRFKLAEDYAYKSSVAKAYEGYRNEASKLDDNAFSTRLFDSALTRLEEPPLRFVQGEDHATPWMEMLNSKAFERFLDSSIENVNYLKNIIDKKSKPSAVTEKEG